MGYFYSPHIGLVEIEAVGEETEDFALIRYYQEKREVLANEIQKIKTQLESKERSLRQLHEQFHYLKELYPEEFI